MQTIYYLIIKLVPIFTKISTNCLILIITININFITKYVISLNFIIILQFITVPLFITFFINIIYK